MEGYLINDLYGEIAPLSGARTSPALFTGNNYCYRLRTNCISFIKVSVVSFAIYMNEFATNTASMKLY